MISAFSIAESFHERFRESLQPAAEGGGTRESGEEAKALNQRIVLEKTHMPKTSASHEEESQKKPNHRNHAEIRRQGGARKMPAKGPVQLNLPEVAVDQFQPGIGSQAGFGKFDLQFSIDAAP